MACRRGCWRARAQPWELLRAAARLLAGLLVDGVGRFAGLQALDHRLDALLLDLLAEVGAVAVDVADAVDDHVPGLPALGRLVQVVVDRDPIAVAALDLGW